MWEYTWGKPATSLIDDHPKWCLKEASDLRRNLLGQRGFDDLLKESHLLESLFSRGQLKNARVMKIDCEFGESTCIVLILFVEKYSTNVRKQDC